ncbi:hypothetical protein BU15DRAFT_84186 [Melanogaster broomeanus]|nr:hypothetical protein BU15DRAFT_84186 [Melanogaster broomeanus]
MQFAFFLESPSPVIVNVTVSKPDPPLQKTITRHGHLTIHVDVAGHKANHVEMVTSAASRKCSNFGSSDLSETPSASLGTSRHPSPTVEWHSTVPISGNPDTATIPVPASPPPSPRW